MNTVEADKYMNDIMDQVDGEQLMNKKKKSPITIEKDSSSDEGEALTVNNRVRLGTLGPKRPIRIGAPKKDQLVQPIINFLKLPLIKSPLDKFSFQIFHSVELQIICNLRIKNF
ncbi:hypothetical protein BV898_01923 [Hypsibius exemplaris]|uniref:Uncharacterized protein n=1 Tax=Hypsibius exemplaris TaxID=2072580 RepID=A0A1W0XAG1_HYPEX|nr:hypothetical protein BV898_01923 [Hypsibius exemplaris]